MEKLLTSGSFRRMVAFLVGMAALVLSKKFGFELSGETQAAVTALVVGYLGQSAYKEAAAAKAKESVKTAEDAAAVFNEEKKP